MFEQSQIYLRGGRIVATDVVVVKADEGSPPVVAAVRFIISGGGVATVVISTVVDAVAVLVKGVTLFGWHDAQ